MLLEKYIYIALSTSLVGSIVKICHVISHHRHHEDKLVCVIGLQRSKRTPMVDGPSTLELHSGLIAWITSYTHSSTTVLTRATHRKVTRCLTFLLIVQ
jgi:hypothetical protein